MGTSASLLTYVVMTFFSALFMRIAGWIKDGEVIKMRKNVRLLMVAIFLILSIYPIILVSGYRINVGTDFPSYVIMFQNPQQYFGIPEAFRTFLIFLNRNNIDVQTIFIITSSIIAISYYMAALLLSSNPSLTIILFIVGEDFFASMNIVRQFMATGIILLAYVSYSKKHFAIAAFLNIVALLIHPSIITFDVFIIVLYFLKNVNVTKSKVIFSLFLTPILLVIIPVLKKLIGLTEYGKFLINSYSEAHYRWTLLMLIIYISILIMVTVFANFNKFDNSSAKKFILANLFVIAILVSSYFLSSNTYRLIYIITPIMYIYYPDIIKSMSNKETQIIVNLLILTILVTGTIIMITHDNNNVIPYYNVIIN